MFMNEIKNTHNQKPWKRYFLFIFFLFFLFYYFCPVVYPGPILLIALMVMLVVARNATF
jgi:hypothetical protein